MNRSTTTISTLVDSQVKKAASAYCKRHGVKLRYFVEKSIIEQLEDEIDLDAYHRRKDEDTVSLESILAKRHKTKKK